MRSDRPSCFTAATVSPPPTAAKPGQAATACATARLPASKGGVSKTPIGPFQNSVAAPSIAAAKAARVAGPMSTASHPACTPPLTGTVRHRRSLSGASSESVTTRSVGRRSWAPWAAVPVSISLARSRASRSTNDEPSGTPRAARKVFDMPPPTSTRSTRGSSRLSASILPRIFAPPTTSTKGRGGSSSRRPSCRSSRSRSRPLKAWSTRPQMAAVDA